MKRTHVLLGGALAVQVLAILVLRGPFSGASTSPESRPLLPVLQAISPVRVEIHGRENKKVTLVKKEGGWGVEEAAGFPADGEKVDGLLRQLKELKVRRPVVTSSRYHEAFEVTDKNPNARVQVWAEGSAQPEIDLIVGSSPDYRTTHVRNAHSDEVFDVRGMASYDLEADRPAWIQKKLVEPTEDQVVGLKVTNAKGGFELEKEDGVWKIHGPESPRTGQLDQDKVASLVRAVVGLRLADAAPESKGSSPERVAPAATVVLRWTPGVAEVKPEGGVPEAAETREVVLEIGEKVEGEASQRYVTRAGLDFTGVIWDSSVGALLEDDLEKLTVDVKKAPGEPRG